MKYVIFTKQQGYVFYICYTETRGFFVSSDAPDSEVLKLDDRDAAQRIADDNSRSGVTYEVKGVEI